MKSTVAVCIPSGENWKARTAVAYAELRLLSAVNDIGTATLNYQCSVISMSRNTLTRMALALDPPCSHILWIDSDIVMPPDGLVRLLSHDKDIVGAFYNRRTAPYSTVGHLLEPSDVSKGGLHRASVMPFGFVLVKRHVFEKISSPWFSESYDPVFATKEDPDGAVGEDVGFSRKAISNGVEMWCDADLTFEIGHIGEAVVPCLRPESIVQGITSPEVSFGDGA